MYIIEKKNDLNIFYLRRDTRKDVFRFVKTLSFDQNVVLIHIQNVRKVLRT